MDTPSALEKLSPYGVGRAAGMWWREVRGSPWPPAQVGIAAFKALPRDEQEPWAERWLARSEGTPQGLLTRA